LQGFEASFEAGYGVSLDQLAQRYDRGLERRLGKLEEQASYLESGGLSAMLSDLQQQQADQLLALQERHASVLQAMHQQVGAMQEAARHAQTQLDGVALERNGALEHCHQQYLRAEALEQQLQAMQRSTSWRLTAPVRLAGHVFGGHGKAWLRHNLRRAAPHARLWIARRPAIRRLALAILNRSPWLAGKVRILLAPAAAAVVNDIQHGVIDHAPLTARGRAIELALHTAMKKGQN
jgi:hypothetical protein